MGENFRIENNLSTLAMTYANLGKFDKFCEACSQDQRSFDVNLLNQTLEIILQTNVVYVDEYLSDFETFIVK